MSLKDIRSECTEVAGLLQPYVDGELSDHEQEPVADHLERCSGCRAAVTEQTWVRTTLHAVQREAAPQSLHTRLALRLDEVDREWAAEAQASAPPGLAARVWARLRDLGRGGLIMVPAGAVAVGLFYVVQQGAVPQSDGAASAGYGLGSAILPGAEAGIPHTEAAATPSPSATDDDLFSAIAVLQPQVDFQVQVPSRSDASKGVQLVGATLDRHGDEAPGARLRYQLPGGRHLVDRQLPADALTPRGTQHERSGQSFYLHRTDAGQAMVFVTINGVGHVLVLEGGTGAPGEDGDGTDTPERPDYKMLLKFAAQLGRP